MSTHMPGFQSFSGFLLHVVLVILATTSIRVKTSTCFTSICECRLYLGNMLTNLIKPPIDLFMSLLLRERLIWESHLMTIPGGGGGHSGTEGGRTRVTYFAEEGVFFKTSACPRFCKRRARFVARYEVWGVKIPLQSTKYTRL